MVLRAPIYNLFLVGCLNEAGCHSRGLGWEKNSCAPQWLIWQFRFVPPQGETENLFSEPAGSAEESLFGGLLPPKSSRSLVPGFAPEGPTLPVSSPAWVAAIQQVSSHLSHLRLSEREREREIERERETEREREAPEWERLRTKPGCLEVLLLVRHVYHGPLHLGVSRRSQRGKAWNSGCAGPR